MDAILILAAIGAGSWALVRIGRSALGVLRANRLRARELARAPEAAESALDALRKADGQARDAAREDYALTGALLAGASAAAMFGGRAAAYGQWAVGLYTAGTIGVVAGVGLAVFGAVLRLLARPILEAGSDGSSR